MPASDTFVIGDGGLAGAKAAETLREQGFDGRIVLAAEEAIRPCERPPLSEEYLQGKAAQDKIFVHPPDWYDANHVELLPGTAVTGIDRDRREVTLSGGLVVAGMNVNIWDVNDAIGDLIRSGRPADPARLADPAVPLNDVAAR
jgi:NADPH-dependent 2,4-dienoyl-CoA reductase/sulfur reductase-like enzyme